MFDLKSKSVKSLPKFVLLVPCLVLLSACASKEIKNASLEPLDLPSDSSSYSTPEPEGFSTPAPAVTKKKSSKSKSARLGKRLKKKKMHAAIQPVVPAQPAAVAQVQNTTETLPTIGDDNMAAAPIAVIPMAPPVPFETGLENAEQPNWLLAAVVVAGIVGLIGVAFRVRKQNANRKRRLVYNA